MTPAVLFLVVAIGAPPADFRALTLDGDGPTGSLSAVGADGGVTLAGRALAAGEWYSLRRAGVPLPPWPRAAHAEFANGDRVVGAAVESDGSTLHFGYSDLWQCTGISALIGDGGRGASAG